MISNFNAEGKLNICPICSGRGKVQEGFYRSNKTSWVTNGTGFEICKSCDGLGYIK